MEDNIILNSLNKKWRDYLKEEIINLSSTGIWVKLAEDYKYKTVYPPEKKVFNAFNNTFPSEIKVVILGQDPYHGPNEANGLSFSVSRGIKIPPSLKNIFKELQQDLKIEQPSHGDLSLWTKQGVLLLNSILTVEEDNPGSHSKIGWESFTDAVIKKLSTDLSDIVFILWGKFAEAKQHLISKEKHEVLISSHPSPFSARKSFFGSKPFSKTNDYLINKGKDPINWSLPSELDNQLRLF